MASDRQIKANRKNAKLSTERSRKSKNKQECALSWPSKPIGHHQFDLNALRRFMDRAELNLEGFEAAGVVVAKLELIRVKSKGARKKARRMLRPSGVK